MSIYVLKDGKLVEVQKRVSRETPDFPTPMISRIEAYESPIDGREITSWGQRDRELKDNDCYDPRDFSPGHVYDKSKGRTDG
jgi:hypothetical protein